MSENEKITSESGPLASLEALKKLGQQLRQEMPSKVSDLTNDSGFQTEEQVAALVAAANHLKRKIVDSVEVIDLSAADAAQYIYLVPKPGASGDESGDKYDEYLIIDGALERVGSWEIDLSDYAKATDVVAKEEGKSLSSNDYTDADKAKLDSLEVATDEEINAMLAEVFGT